MPSAAQTETRLRPLACTFCEGEGRIYQSRYGGNDPDVWEAGQCEVCCGSGDQPCEAPKCCGIAVGPNDDGELFCAECLSQWQEDFAA